MTTEMTVGEAEATVMRGMKVMASRVGAIIEMSVIRGITVVAVKITDTKETKEVVEDMAAMSVVMTMRDLSMVRARVRH